MHDPFDTLQKRKARFFRWAIWLVIAGVAILFASVNGWLPSPYQNTAFPAVFFLGMNKEVIALHGLTGRSGLEFQSHTAAVLEWSFLFFGPFTVIGLIYFLLKRKYKAGLRLIGLYALLFFSQLGTIMDVGGRIARAFAIGDVAPSHLARLERLALSSDPATKLGRDKFRFVFSNKSMDGFGGQQFARQYGGKREIVFVPPDKVNRVDARFVHSFLTRLAYLDGDVDKAQLHFRKLGAELSDAISWQHFLVAEWLIANRRDIGLSGPQLDEKFQILRYRRILSTAGIAVGSLLVLFSLLALGLVVIISMRSRRLEVFRVQRANYIARETETAQTNQFTATFSTK